VPLAGFDLVIPPEHDGVTGPNVFPIVGPPVWFSQARIDDSLARFPSLRVVQGQKVLVSIGGDSKNHKMTEANVAAIESAIQRLAQGRTFWITVSRRTPEHARVRFRRLATTINGIFWENQERDGPNPYVAFLSQCDAAMVTCESANMIADPAFFGKPVHLLKLDGGSPRLDKLHAGLIDRRAARLVRGLEHGLQPVGAKRSASDRQAAEDRSSDDGKPHDVRHGRVVPRSFSSSSSWMMIRGVTISIRLSVVRPRPTFLKRRLM
jgi:mitochondrial fission protein ELM1